MAENEAPLLRRLNRFAFPSADRCALCLVHRRNSCARAYCGKPSNLLLKPRSDFSILIQFKSR